MSSLAALVKTVGYRLSNEKLSRRDATDQCFATIILVFGEDEGASIRFYQFCAVVDATIINHRIKVGRNRRTLLRAIPHPDRRGGCCGVEVSARDFVDAAIIICELHCRASERSTLYHRESCSGR